MLGLKPVIDIQTKPNTKSNSSTQSFLRVQPESAIAISRLSGALPRSHANYCRPDVASTVVGW